MGLKITGAVIQIPLPVKPVDFFVGQVEFGDAAVQLVVIHLVAVKIFGGQPQDISLDAQI